MLGLVLEEGGGAIAVAALHRVLDRFLQTWLVLRRAGEMDVLRFGIREPVKNYLGVFFG